VEFREFVQHKTVRFLMVAGLLLGGYVGYGVLTAPGRIAPALRARLAQGGYADIAVVLPFAPEQFHLNMFQQIGTVRGVKGTTVLIARVPVAEVRRLARYYWITRIEPLTAVSGDSGRGHHRFVANDRRRRAGGGAI
jgi:hypothetical protein